MDFGFSEINRERVVFPKQKRRILKSELIHWKSTQCKKFLETKSQIMKRLQKELGEVCSLLDKISAKTLKLSYIFRELDFQETALNFKMKHGFSWKKKLEE